MHLNLAAEPRHICKKQNNHTKMRCKAPEHNLSIKKIPAKPGACEKY
jgi:hypothetical protein